MYIIEGKNPRIELVHDYSLHFHTQGKVVPPSVTSDKSKRPGEADDLYRLATLDSCLNHKKQKGDSPLGPTLAPSGGNYALSRDRVAVEGSLQTRCRPEPHPDSGNHIRPQKKKTTITGSTGQMPPGLISELSTVLNKTGRTPREES